MRILQKLGLARKAEPAPAFTEEGYVAAVSELIDAPKPQAVRDAVNKFAAGRVQGFIDEELYRAFPGVSQSQLRTRRNELFRDGLIVRHRRGTNAAGASCQIWLHVEFTGQPAKPQQKRLTYSQLQQKLKTAELELELRHRRIDALVRAMMPSPETKAAYIGEVQMPVALDGYDAEGDPLEGSKDVTVSWDATKAIMKLITAQAERNFAEGVTPHAG